MNPNIDYNNIELSVALATVDNLKTRLSSCEAALAERDATVMQWSTERDKLVRVLQDAYLYMLQTPHDGVRITSQSTFAKVRDMIADATDTSIREVQEEYEEQALLIRLRKEGQL